MPSRYQDGPYFEIRYGKASFPTGMTRVTAFVLEGEDREYPSKKLPRCRPGGSETVDSEAWGDYGFWYIDYLAARPGDILYIQSETSVRQVPQAGAGIILRIRPTAAMIEVRTTIHPHATSRYSELPVFVGNADVLEYAQAHELHGIVMRRFVVNNYLEDLDEFEEVFTVRELAPATGPAPEIVRFETESGVRAVAIDPPARRKIKAGKK